MSKLELILLGQFECLLPSGTRISLSMRKAEVLLAYLALTPGFRHPRERLINLLWSDRSEEQARNSLRQCLSAVKKSLGDVADMVLQVDRTTVSLIPELIDIDVHEFERLAAEGDYESLTTAADLYQGEFLEGISIRDASCQEWLDSERGRFKRQFIEILSELAETQLLSHDFGNAIKSSERLVKQDPLGESGWRQLMRSYFEKGDRSHALQAFKRCQQALREELNVEPESATIELRDQIAAGENKPAQAPTPAIGESSFDTPATTAYRNGESSPAYRSSTDHSIAVLPFDNLSGDPEQEYFSDGITDSIILNLSLFPGLNVKSRNSSFAFKQQIKSIGEISNELGVDYVVEGSIRRSNDRIRITVQLIDAAEGNQIWGKRYDADLADLFTLEEELSRTIAATVTGQIDSELQRIAIAKGAAGQQAYDLLLSGTYHAQRFNRQDTVIAIDKLNQCLAQDADNVRAHVMLYACHSMDYLERWVEDFRASFKLAAENIKKALALDPESALVQAYYAEYLIFNGESDKAVKHLNKALEINPNDPDAMTIMALSLELEGDFEAALKMAERSYRLDPYHPWLDWELAVCRYFCGQYEATLETIENARTSPSFTRIFSVAANVKLGRIDAAREALQFFLQECRENMLSMPTTRDEFIRYIRDNYPFKNTSDNQDVVECLITAGLADELATRGRSSDSETHAIAVLPFDNLSGDPEQEYFSDGITESIILNLSLFPGLNVKSRNSSFAFKQQIKSIGEISKELEVDYIVEGSIRKTDERVRVTVQLVDATSGNQVWGKRYDAEIENLFDLEEELSRTIATTVTGQIESDLQRIAIANGAAHQQSYDLLLQGIYHCKKSTAPDMVIAIEKLHQCLALDSNNALAHATLYACHEMNWIDRWVSDFEASRKLCREHASKALVLNPELGLVQVVFAEYLIFNRDYDAAEAHLNRALEINPNDSEAIAAVALNLSCQGKFEAALEQARLALKLDSYHTWARWILSEAQFFCGLYEEVLATIADTGNPPGFVQVYKIAANVRLGRIDVANSTLKSFLQHCGESMSSMPRTIDEWLAYSRDNAPFADPAINQEIVDYLVQAGLEEELGSPRSLENSGQQPGILVLPFSNLSGDPEQEYFSDGITESIIVNLSSFNGLNVKSRHTSFAFKNSEKSIDELAAELGIQYIVEGSIRKFGDKVRITVQVDETASGNQLWGKRFESELEDLFSLEEELVQTIVGTISGRIGKDIKSAALQKPAKDLKSYDYLMRGLYHLEKFTAADNRIAREQFQKSIEHDPGNCEAHAFLGVTYVMELYENWTAERDEARRLMAVHTSRALELEPDNALAHAIMSEQLLFSRDFEHSAVHAERTIELNPTLPDGYSMKCGVLGSVRRYDEALEYADISMKIDPYHPYIGWNAGEVYRSTGQYERSVKAFRSIPHISPSLRAQTAASLAGMGKEEEARTEMQRYLELAHEQMPSYPASENEWRTLWHEGVPYLFEEDSKTLFDLLLKAGLCDEITTGQDDIPSIAVLPFENMSGDPEQEYFSDGITNDIVTTLSHIRRLRVVARHSTLIYKDHKPSISDIANEQGVRYILDGSVRKSGKRIRVNAQLIDSETGENCWAENYDRKMKDIFAVQDEITRNIAVEMQVHLISGDAARKTSIGTSSFEAWELVTMAWDLQDSYVKDNMLKAQQLVDKALKLDPEYSSAWVILGWTHWQGANTGLSESIDDSIREAGNAADKALAIDPENAEALVLKGCCHVSRNEPELAIEACSRAVEISPGDAEVQALMSYTYNFTGDYDKALPHHEASLRLCPICPNWFLLVGGTIYQHTGDLEKAIEMFRKGVEVEPESPLCRYYLIDVLMDAGRETEAQACADEIRALGSSFKISGMLLGHSHDQDVRERYRANLKKVGLDM